MVITQKAPLIIWSTSNVSWVRGCLRNVFGLTFIIVYIQVIWCGEYCDQGRESCCLTFSVHSVSVIYKEARLVL